MKSISKLKDEARRHEQREEWEKAIQVYLQVLESGDEGEREIELPLYNRIGDLSVRLGKAHDAVRYYEMAADRYADAGLYNNAIALCNKAMRYDARNLGLIRKLGQYSASQGFITDARRYFLEYAEHQFRAGATDDGLSALEDFANLADDAEVRELLGRRLLAHGRIDQGVAELRRAHDMHVAAGETEAAAALRREVLDLNPDAFADDGARPGVTTAPPPSRREALPFIAPFGGDAADTPAFEITTPPQGEDDDDPFAQGPRPDPDAIRGAEPVDGRDSGDAELEWEIDGASDEDAESGVTGLEDIESVGGAGWGPPPEVDRIEGLEPTSVAFDAAADVDLTDLGLDIEHDEAFELPMLREEPMADIDAPDQEEAPVFELPTLSSSDSHDVPILDELSFDSPTFEIEVADEPAAMATPDELLLPGVDADVDATTGWPAPSPADAALDAEIEEAARLASDVEAALDAAGLVDDEIEQDDEPLPTAEPDDAGAVAVASDDEVMPAAHADAETLATEDDAVHVAEAAPPVEETVPAADPVAPVPADETEPPAGEDYIDLGALLTDEGEETTRFRVEETTPTGDEDRDFAELLTQFRSKVSEHLPPEDAAAHYDLGIAFKEMGLIDEAITEFQVALRTGHMRLKVYEELGHCFLKKEQFNIAVKVLQRALEMSFEDELELLGVYYHLGRAFEGMGRSEQARDAYERVLGMDYGFQDAADRLARL